MSTLMDFIAKSFITKRLIPFYFLFVFTNCQKENFDAIIKDNNVESQIVVSDINPYSLDRMQMASDSMAIRNKLKSKKILVPTHYYVRYRPANGKEYDELLSDTATFIFDYPLVGNNDEPISPKDPSDTTYKQHWCYTVVPTNYVFKNIEHEIIDKLYQPSHNMTAVKSDSDQESWEELEAESMKQAGYIKNDTSATKLKWSLLGWIPEANIKVYDDVTRTYLPVENVKVMVRNLTVFWLSTTNSSGRATFPRYGLPLKYEAYFENSHWTIRSNDYLRAIIDGPTKSSTWNLNINDASREQVNWATVQRACNRYFYNNIGGLRRPSSIDVLKICCYNHDGGDANGMSWGVLWQKIVQMRLPVEFPNIQIWKQSKTQKVFESTIHELGHISHMNLLIGLGHFANVPDYITESWAVAVEWYITKIEYSELSATSYMEANEQDWTSLVRKNYSPLFIDLVDNVNQCRIYGSLPSNQCPSGGMFDGASCLVATPPQGSNSFIYGGSYYYTPLGCCTCGSGSFYDGGNCFALTIPNDVIEFIYNNRLYYMPAGNPQYPNDYVSGYSMSQIESNIIANADNLSSAKSYAMGNKPAGVTDKQLDILFSFYVKIYN